MSFQKGDILWGKEKGKKKARHPIVYISGTHELPTAVILTHSKNHTCNIPLPEKIDNQTSYFIAHLIEKVEEWGPYKKAKQKISANSLALIDQHTKNQKPITWAQYVNYTMNGCPEHKKRPGNNSTK